MYEAALTDAVSQASVNCDRISTTTMYNLARVYENQGNTKMACKAYEKLLTQHPEYVDGAYYCSSGCRHVFTYSISAKIHQAQLLVNLNRSNDAHKLIKQALTSQKNKLNLRVFYTHLLIQYPCQSRQIICVHHTEGL
jgi:RNA polymerase-associated protein CTR9